jgi:signal transduction histidine kinase
VRRAALAALACAGAAIGILAERQGYAWSDLRGWVPDLLAGWTLIGVGLALLGRRSDGAGALLLAAGFTWFAFNFGTADSPAIAWLAVHAAYLHRGPLFHLAVALPSGRPRTRLAAAGVGLAWTAAVAWPLWDDGATALLLGLTFVAIAAFGWTRARGRSGRLVAGRGLLAAMVLTAAIAADAIRSSAGAPQDVADATILAYDVAVVLAGVALFSAARLAGPTALAERAIALETGGERLRDVLRELLGDPALELGFGTDADTLDPESGLVATPVLVRGRRVAVVVHDPATLGDEATREAVLAAVGLAAERVRLRAELGRQIEAVDASRRRLLLAEEDERRRLARRLERGAGAELGRVEELAREAQLHADRDAALATALERARDRLRRVRPELETLVRGLGGVEAAELVPALERLAAALPVDVELELNRVAVTSEVSAALWFVCSESLANAVKHAEARVVRVKMDGNDGVVRLVVEDDGRGGADPHGSGLVGLADRVSALGGRLTVASPPGGGTRLVAELPLAH